MRPSLSDVTFAVSDGLSNYSAAQLTVEKTGNDSMRLTVTDTDPKTGKTMVTSRIDLQRS